VNVTDFEDVEIPAGDMLQGIFTAQAKLMGKYHDIEHSRGALVIDPDEFGNIDHRFVQWRIKDLAFREIEELTEATNTLKNKPWKVSEVPTDKVHYYEEIADSFHFFIELCITSGMTAADLAKIYHRKHAVNEFRQRSNY
jgi:dimeric dUTPase (all-alpha-NTP-PPase superfamily)